VLVNVVIFMRHLKGSFEIAYVFYFLTFCAGCV
jgi:hypothetical protein